MVHVRRAVYVVKNGDNRSVRARKAAGRIADNERRRVRDLALLVDLEHLGDVRNPVDAAILANLLRQDAVDVPDGMRRHRRALELRVLALCDFAEILFLHAVVERAALVVERILVRRLERIVEIVQRLDILRVNLVANLSNSMAT